MQTANFPTSDHKVESSSNTLKPVFLIKKSLTKIESNKAVEFAILLEVGEGEDHRFKHRRRKFGSQVNAVLQ